MEDIVVHMMIINVHLQRQFDYTKNNDSNTMEMVVPPAVEVLVTEVEVVEIVVEHLIAVSG